MSVEINHDPDSFISPEWIWGQEEKIPSVAWNGHSYELKSLSLPVGWKDFIKTIPKDVVSNIARIHLGERNDSSILMDEETGIVTEIKFDKNSNSKVRLNMTSSSMGGKYLTENVTNLYEAIKYQEFLSVFLDFVSDGKISYSYMNYRGFDNSGSVNLKIPQKIDLNKQIVFNRNMLFDREMWKISGMFGATIEQVNFDDKGILYSVRVGGSDTNYTLDVGSRTYYHHNVDDIYNLAALHGIVAEYINELLGH